MMESDQESSSVISLKMPSRYTKSDIREKIALCADTITKLRLFSSRIEQELDLELENMFSNIKVKRP